MGFQFSNLSAFIKNPDDYVIRLVNDNHLIAEEKGAWTWIKAHTFWKNEYKLAKIVETVNKNFDHVDIRLVVKINNKITRYNESHSESEKISKINWQAFQAGKADSCKRRKSMLEAEKLQEQEPPEVAFITASEKTAISKKIDEEAKARRMRILEAKKLQEQEPPEVAFIKAAVWRHLEPYLARKITLETEDINRPALPSLILKELKEKFPGKTFDPSKVTRQVFNEYIYIAASQGVRAAFSSEGKIQLHTASVVTHLIEQVRHAVAIDFKGYAIPRKIEVALKEAVDKCLSGYGSK